MARKSAAIGRAIREDLSVLLRDTMLTALDALINTNPVDTTHSSKNWIITTHAPYQGIDGSRDAPSDAVQQASIDRIQTYDIGRDGSIYIRNNVEYVQFLDQGSSSQAPAGWVGACFRDAGNTVRRGMKTRVRKLLRGMARGAYRKGI